MDQKIDEVLKVVREQGERNELRFTQIETHLKEHVERSEIRDKINNDRFEHISNGIDGLRIEMREVKEGVTKMNTDLNAKIDHTYNSLSQDITAFAGDLHDLDRRVTRLEKKSLS